MRWRGSRPSARPHPQLRVAQLVVALVGCTPAPQVEPPVEVPVVEQGLAAPSAMAKYLPTAPGEALCARGNDDRVTRYFCQRPAPRPTSLRELEAGLELLPESPSVGIAFTAHSTALGTRAVNPLNPRAIVFDGVPRDRLSRRRFVALGFTRGEPVVELVTRDETSQELRFFVVVFSQPCDATQSCTTADRLTSATEANWQSVTLFEDRDLENTALDCLRCHQPDGPGSKRILRMQELRFPWTHFLAPKDQSVTGFELVRDYFSAHGVGEAYAGVPGALILERSDPNLLSQLLAQESSGDQPNEFNGFTINLEREATGESATWNALAARAASGEAIPTPWWGLRVTDPATQASLADRYQRAVREQRPAEVPELRERFTEEVERATGVRPTAAATGAQLLVQACAQCHQPKRNQALSRARFDVLRLPSMSAQERQLAAERMRLPVSDVLHMPPSLTTVLTDEERDRAIGALDP